MTKLGFNPEIPLFGVFPPEGVNIYLGVNLKLENRYLPPQGKNPEEGYFGGKS